MKDSDTAIDEIENEEEECIDYMKRSTQEVEEEMKSATIPCWIEAHRKRKWRLVMRNASLPEERWSRKAVAWNPGLISTVKTNRPVGRPRKRWEDEINEFLRCKESEESRGNDLKNDDTWIE